MNRVVAVVVVLSSVWHATIGCHAHHGDACAQSTAAKMLSSDNPRPETPCAHEHHGHEHDSHSDPDSPNKPCPPCHDASCAWNVAKDVPTPDVKAAPGAFLTASLLLNSGVDFPPHSQLHDPDGATGPPVPRHLLLCVLLI